MILTPSVYQIVVMIFAGLVLTAAITDIRSLTIPNRVSAAICMLYPAFVLTAQTPVPWLEALAVAAIALAVCFFLFARGWLGGGDGKLIAAITLWAAPDYVVEFILITTAAGGVLAVALWFRSRLSHATIPNLEPEDSPNSTASKRQMPYAVAIACGGLYVAFTLIGVGLPRLPL